MSYCFGLERGQGLSEASEINVWTRWVPSAMPLCVPTLFSRQWVHKNTKLSMYHTKLYQTIQNNMNLCPDAKPYSPDNESIKHGSWYNSFQGCFLGNRLSRLKVIIRIRNITSKDLQTMSLMTSLQESWSRLCRRIGQTLRHAAGSFAAIRRCCGAV